MPPMFTHSIRWRFQLWLGFLLICLLTGFGITAYHLHRTNQFNELDQELGRRVSALGTALRTRAMTVRPTRPGDTNYPSAYAPEKPNAAPRRLRLPPHAQTFFDESDADAFYYVIWTRDGALSASSSNAPPWILRPETGDTSRETHLRTRGVFRESFYINSLGECALAGRSIAADLAGLRHFAGWLVAGGIAILALGLGGGWWLVSQALRPVRDISAGARRISEGNLSERIPAAQTAGELGQLAEVLNSAFARLEAAFAQQKQFTADASHELRTPLAVIISEAQATLARERSPAEYRETIKTCHEAAQQMRRLTEALLQLARFDAEQEAMTRTPLDLAELARAAVELLRPLALERGISLQADLAPAPVLGDRDLLHRAITNLLANAIHYNRPQGEVHIATVSGETHSLCAVKDTGIGIPREELPHIFKRFYRVDKARARADGHHGLGLAISKIILDNHGGTIEVASEPGAGSTFTLRLPRQ